MPRAGLGTDNVTAAAGAIVDAEGVGALTLVRLASDLGVAPPSLYKHIRGLDDLIDRVTTRAIQRLADELAAADPGQPGRGRLVAIATTYRGFATQHPGFYWLTQTGVRTASAERQAAAARALAVFIAVVAGYGVPESHFTDAIRLVRAGLHGFVDIEARGGFQMPHSVGKSFAILVDMLDASLTLLADRTPG